ncbi:MAG: CbrC family protein [Planctomycetaceae bacterium]
MPLPIFKYHPDPVATGHVVESDTECACCGEVRGFIYDGPVYAIEEYDRCICPWCIADGSAHDKLDASFTDEVGIGGGGRWEEVSEEIIQEVAYRTPGFCGWQQEQWWTHCGDAAQFIGRAGRTELNDLGPQAIAAVQTSAGLSDGPEWDEFFAALDKDGSPTAYMFRCTKCGRLGAYQDWG